MRAAVHILFIFIWGISSAQNNNSDIKDIKFYADVMTNASEVEHRVFAFEKLQTALKNYTKSKDFVLSSLESVKHIKVLPVQDRKLVSYQVLTNQDRSRSIAFLIDSKGNMLDFKPSKDLQDVEFEELDPSQKWVEGLYYFAKPFYQNSIKDTAYLLFSYQQIDQFTKQKVIDVLYFRDGQPVLGNESFVFPKQGSRDFVQNRLIFNYSSDVVMSVAYIDDKDRIVLDHLMEVKGRMPGQMSTMVPDGTYDAFANETGKFKFIDLLYDDRKPAEKKGESNKEKRDLFGRKIE